MGSHRQPTWIFCGVRTWLIKYRKYASIGSGNDMADNFIAVALDSMNLHERDKIDKRMGATILIEATQAAWRKFPWKHTAPKEKRVPERI